ncbi:aminopeptidase M1-like isoform X2 [Fagus crenata]
MTPTNVPSELTALSNMPIADEKLDENIKTVYFEESPIMQRTWWLLLLGYLIILKKQQLMIIALCTAGIKVRVYCPVGKSDKGKFALHVAVKSLDIFTR